MNIWVYPNSCKIDLKKLDSVKVITRIMKIDINNYFDCIRSVMNNVAAIIKTEKNLPDREHCGTPEIVTEVYLAALQYDYSALVYQKYKEKFDEKHIKKENDKGDDNNGDKVTSIRKRKTKNEKSSKSKFIIIAITTREQMRIWQHDYDKHVFIIIYFDCCLPNDLTKRAPCVS